MTEPGKSGQILVINGGSSSIKFSVLDLSNGTTLAKGLAQRLGEELAQIDYAIEGQKSAEFLSHGGHQEALSAILDKLRRVLGTKLQIQGVGHRVVHGGEFFKDATLINDEVIRLIEACSPLAPLHNPAHLLGIRAAMACFPAVPQVAVFDTAFHQTLPPHAFHYAVPYELYEKHRVRRYGFHGTSHQYVSGEAARRMQRPLEDLQLLTAHLGNGCSTCAIRNGKSVDTSMGLTPLEGVVMGTRSGDVDPNLHQFLADTAGLSLREITDMLNRQSGLLGLSGLSNDMRSLLDAATGGNERASLAIDLFCYRLAKSLLGMAASLERIDALIFTGGIGENSPQIRELTLGHLQVLQPLQTLVIPTNEELMIARQTTALL